MRFLRLILLTPGFAQSFVPGAPTSPTPPTQPHATEEDKAEEVEGIRSFFHERLFRTASLNFALQFAVGAAIGFSIGAALLILFAQTLRPTAIVEVGQFLVSAPLATVITIRLFWILGWSLALTGALHGNWLTRSIVFVVFAFMVGQDFVATYIASWVAFSYGWPLIALAIYLIVASILTSRARAAHAPLPKRLPMISFATISVLLLLYYTLLYVSLALIGGGGLALIVKSILNNFNTLAGMILPIYFLAGSDFVEWAQVSSGEVSHWLLLRKRTPWLLFAITAVVSGVILWYRLTQRGDFQIPLIFATLDIVEMALIGVVVYAIFLLLARLGRVGQATRIIIPVWALAIAALSALGLVTLDIMLVIFTNQSLIGSLFAEVFNAEIFAGNGAVLLGVMPLLVAVLVGLPLLVTGRKRPVLAVSGLFLLVFGLRSALLYLPNLLQLFGLPTEHLPVHVGSFSAHTTIPPLSLPMIQIIVAMFTLLYMAWLIVRRAPQDYMMDSVANLFILNGGLQALVWLSQLLSTSESFSAADLPAVAALLLVLAFLWDFLTSGEQTNGNSQRLPRFVRVCIYAGYSIVAITITLYLSIAPASAQAFDPEVWTPSGVTDLGVAMLLTVFVIGVVRARAQAKTKPEAATAVPQPQRAPSVARIANQP